MMVLERVLDWLRLSPEEWSAIRVSLLVASVAALASLPFGIAAAWLLARGQFAGKAFFAALVYTPLVAPPIVTGYCLLLLLGRKGALGAWLDSCCGIVFSFHWTGAALACAVMGFPLMARAIQISFSAIDPRLEAAAASLGASKLRRFFTISLPLALPGVIAGVVLCFAKALGEFGATITFASNIPGQTQTISAAIYNYTQMPDGDFLAYRLAIISILISLGALLASEYLTRRAQRGPGNGRSGE